MYRPRPPKKNFLSYLLPFVVIVWIFTLIIYSFQSLILKKEYFKNTFATLHPWEKWTEVMLSWSEDWNFVSKNIKLFKWDVVKTSDFASINLIWESEINLDKWAIVLIDKLQSSNSSSQVSLTIPEWRVWLDIKRMINPKSVFEIKTENLHLSTRHWIFSLNWNSLRVLEWSVALDFYDWKKLLWHLDIWVWQEMILSDSDLNSLKIWTLPSLRAINDEFKLSSWYSKNYLEDWKILEKTDLEISEEIVKTVSENWTWDLVLEVEENSEISKTEENKEAIVEKVVHEWEITLDIESNDFEIEKDEIVNLSWKVPTWVSSVVVNDWKLSKFQAWDLNYYYNAALKWENLKEWENIYKIEVFDADNVIISKKEFKINVKIKEELVEEVDEKIEGEVDEKIEEDVEIKTEEKNEEEDLANEKIEEVEVIDESWDSENILKIETTLQITSHQEWDFVKILEWQSLEIQWIPSSWAVKINVWDYTLTSFKEWDEKFIFRIAEEWGNVKIWEKNTYKITSFDKDWNEIETLKFSLFAEK